MAFAIFQPIRVLPRMSLAPGYSLIDQDGKQFTSESMRGSLVLYTFSHSQCSSPCVPTSATLAALQPELSEVQLGDIPLQFVTIFVDPEHATPEVLGTQAEMLGIDPERWHFVTGDATQLKQVIGSGFSTYYAPTDTHDDANADINADINANTHDSSASFTVDPVFVLVDGWGIIRAVYRTPSPDSAIIQRDLGLVVQEIRNSTGVNRYAYEAAHLFLCYPKS